MPESEEKTKQILVAMTAAEKCFKVATPQIETVNAALVRINHEKHIIPEDVIEV